MDFKDRKWNLSVPSVRDIEAPLGGTSTVYEIVLIEGDEQFSYTRTFREIEDFVRKLQKKFTSETFPALPSGTDVEVRRQAVQTFLNFISEKPNVISSSITQQFMGQDRSVKYIVKDRNQNSTAPLATVNNDLYEDLFQESSYLSNKKKSNLFDDDSCELFYSTPEKIVPDQGTGTGEMAKPPEEPAGASEGQADLESDGDEVDQLFVPRRGTPLKAGSFYEESEDLFSVDDNLNDLLISVSARAESAKLKAMISPPNTEREMREIDPSPSTALPFVPQSKPKKLEEVIPGSDVRDGTGPVKPSVPAKPVVPAKPKLASKPVPKPKPVHLQTKPKAEAQTDRPTSTVPNTQQSELDPADIGSYILAAEKDTLRQVSLFDD